MHEPNNNHVMGQGRAIIPDTSDGHMHANYKKIRIWVFYYFLSTVLINVKKAVASTNLYTEGVDLSGEVVLLC
jgi:hypothetical protein